MPNLWPMPIQRFVTVGLMCATLFGFACFAHAAWNGQYYEPGETLDPECLPSQTNCDVNPVMDAAHGGTGLTEYDPGDLIYADSATSLARLSLGIDGKVLKIVGGNLAWADDSAGTIFSADGQGIELSGSTFALELDGSTLTKSASGLRLSATYPGQTSITTLGTITAGTWNGAAIGDAYLTKTGDWTGMFDGVEGSAYLSRANHTGTQAASTISDFTSSARSTISTTVTGLAYTSGTGILSTTSGYAIPTTTSQTNWDSAFSWGNHANAGYAVLGGKAGGQSLTGGINANDVLTLQANSATGNSATNTGIQFRVGDSASTTAMTILNNGNIGIGGTNSTAKLNINADGGTAGVLLRIQDTSATAGYATTGIIQTFQGNFVMQAATSGKNIGLWDSTAERLTVRSGGTVGIGNTSPTHKLDIVAGSLTSTQRALSVTGTLNSTVARQVGAQMDFTTSAGNTNENDGFFVRLLPGNTSSAYNIAGLFTNTVAGTGTNVIGGTANYAIYGDATSTTTGTNVGFYGQAAGGNISIGASGTSTIAKNSATNIGILGLGLNTGTTPVQIGGYFGLSSLTPTFASAALMADNGSTTSPAFMARDNGTDIFRIEDGGNVSIGATTTGAKLDLAEAGTGITASWKGYQGRNSGSTFNTTSGALTNYISFFNNTATRATGSNALTNVGLYASASGAQVNYAAIFDQGSVGIGTTTPARLLDVSSAQPVFRITNTTNLGTTAWAGTEIAKMEFYSSDPSGPSVVANISTIGAADSTGGVPGGDLAFFTKNVAGTLNEKMRINGNGNITMTNSASSTYSLRLIGTRQASSGDIAVVSLENAGTSSADVLTLKQTGEAGSAESQFVTFYTNAGLIGSINSNGSGVVAYNTTSDRRVKDNIEETSYGIDDVLKIPVRDYTMRQDSKHLKQTGFIAQELVSIYPDAVSKTDDGLSPLGGQTPWSVDYGRLTPLLVKSIQDQQLLLGDISDKDGLSMAIANTRQEMPLRAFEYISTKIQDGWRPLKNLAALRLSAIRGYFDEVFAKRTHQEELCIGTPGNETCLTKSDLDALLSNSPSQSSSPPTVDNPTPPETPPDEPAASQ